MKIFNLNIGNKTTRHQKKSLMRILYVFPILFFYIGLGVIFTYYTLVQVQKYELQVEQLKKDFPEKQRAELQLKVLLLKNYIYWVKSHPDEYANDYIKDRIYTASSMVSGHLASLISGSGHLPATLHDSLDRLNASGVSKVIILDRKMNVIYSDTSSLSKSGITGSKLNGRFGQIELSQASSKIKEIYKVQNRGEHFLFTRQIKNSSYIAGILIDATQKTKILQDIVLDSLSKVKYTNNEYAFINTFDGYALLSKGNRQIPPLLIKKSTETNWKEIFNKELECARLKEGGYYTYFWRNNTNVERSEKTSYFSAITEWEWIIGTGFFTNAINPVIEKMNAELWKDITNNLFQFLIFLCLLSVLAYMIIRIYVRDTRSNILQFLHFFKRAASGGFQIIDTDKLAFSEFDTLAKAANKMIQEREKIKSVLSAEKSRLQYMINAIPDLIFFKDANSKFLGCNAAFEKYISRSSDEIIGFTEYDLFPKEEASDYIARDIEIIRSHKPEQTTNWVQYPDGQKRLLFTLKTPYFDSDNRILGIIGISRDVTEMEETRQRLIMAKEKAEESDKLKTAFLANMSHEIRTPMNAIIGFSDLMAEDDLTIEEKHDYISKIKNAGVSLMALINDIIDIAKIEAGQLRISESNCDINHILSLLHGTFNELINTSGNKDINLVLAFPERETPLYIITDPQRLQQILSNLLSNAMKFTDSGTIEFGYKIQEDSLFFYVKDSGIGIPADKQEQLFQRFSQLDSGTTRKYGGTGLGLAISKNLVELLGGTIGMRSNRVKGSMFYFTLPLKTTDAKPPKSVNTARPVVNWKGKTILIAEDIMQNFILMEALLKQSEVRLLHAINGQVAIDIVKSDPKIDLVLMDLHLPLKTGYEALKEITEIKPGLAVMSYTAFALPNEREKSLAAGFVEFIPKPIKAETLIPLLDKYLRNQG